MKKKLFIYSNLLLNIILICQNRSALAGNDFFQESQHTKKLTRQSKEALHLSQEADDLNPFFHQVSYVKKLTVSGGTIDLQDPKSLKRLKNEIEANESTLNLLKTYILSDTKMSKKIFSDEYDTIKNTNTLTSAQVEKYLDFLSTPYDREITPPCPSPFPQIEQTFSPIIKKAPQESTSRFWDIVLPQTFLEKTEPLTQDPQLSFVKKEWASLQKAQSSSPHDVIVIDDEPSTTSFRYCFTNIDDKRPHRVHLQETPEPSQDDSTKSNLLSLYDLNKEQIKILDDYISLHSRVYPTVLQAYAHEKEINIDIKSATRCVQNFEKRKSVAPSKGTRKRRKRPNGSEQLPPRKKQRTNTTK